MATGKKTAKRPAKKKAASSKAPGGKVSAKAAVKKAPAPKAPAGKAAAVKKAPSRKAPAGKAARSKVPAGKAPAKAAVKKAPPLKAPLKKAAAVKKAPAPKAPVKKAAATKAPAQKVPVKAAVKTSPAKQPAVKKAAKPPVLRAVAPKALRALAPGAPPAPVFPNAATIITLQQYNGGETQYQPWNRADFRYRMLAQGDSWFSVNGVPTFSPFNILQGLRFEATAAIVSLAYPGTELQYLANMSSDATFRQLLNDERYGGTWDIILFSGGGNDLIDRAPDLLQLPPDQPAAETADFVNQPALQQLMSDIRAGYTDVVNARDATGSPNQNVPIIAHTYSYITPRNAPALRVPRLGPWLYKALTSKGIDSQYWGAVSNYLVDAMADTLFGLAGTLPNLIVFDTRCVLTPAAPGTTGSSNDFLNEIHPNAAGYTKLGGWLSTRLAPLLAARPQ